MQISFASKSKTHQRNTVGQNKATVSAYYICATTLTSRHKITSKKYSSKAISTTGKL